METDQKIKICDDISRFFFRILSENKKLVLINVCLEIALPILEIILYRKIADDIIENLSSQKKYSILMSILLSFRGYIYFFFLLQFGYLYNKYIINLLIPRFRITVREKIMKEFVEKVKDDENNYKNIDLTIVLNAMPTALFQGYHSILKYIIPLICLLMFITIVIFRLDTYIALISLTYSIVMITITYLMIKYLMNKAAFVWNMHGVLVKQYDTIYSEKLASFTIDELNSLELDKIRKEEETFESERLKLFSMIHFFVFFYICSFFSFSIYIIYLFSKYQKKKDSLQKVCTLLFFSLKLLNTILLKTKMLVNSFGRLKVLNDKLFIQC